MSGVNRYFQRKRFAEFQPLSMQEMAYPYEKQEARTKENMAMAMKMSQMGLDIDNLAVDNPYAEQLLTEFQQNKDQAVNYALTPNASYSDIAKKFMGVFDLKNQLESTGGKYLGQRKALQLAELERLKNAKNLSETDRNYLQGQINNIFTETYTGEGNPLEGAKNVNWTDSYDFEDTTKNIVERLSKLKAKTLSPGTIGKLKDANDYTEIWQTLKGEGVDVSTISQAMSPWITSEIDDKTNKISITGLNETLQQGILQGYAASGKPLYDEEGNYTKEAEAYLNEETSKLFNTGMAQAYSNWDSDFKFLEDAVDKMNYETNNSIVEGIGANSLNIIPTATVFEGGVPSLKANETKITTLTNNLSKFENELVELNNIGASPRTIANKQRQIDVTRRDMLLARKMNSELKPLFEANENDIDQEIKQNVITTIFGEGKEFDLERGNTEIVQRFNEIPEKGLLGYTKAAKPESIYTITDNIINGTYKIKQSKTGPANTGRVIVINSNDEIVGNFADGNGGSELLKFNETDSNARKDLGEYIKNNLTNISRNTHSVTDFKVPEYSATKNKALSKEIDEFFRNPTNIMAATVANNVLGDKQNLEQYLADIDNEDIKDKVLQSITDVNTRIAEHPSLMDEGTWILPIQLPDSKGNMKQINLQYNFNQFDNEDLSKITTTPEWNWQSMVSTVAASGNKEFNEPLLKEYGDWEYNFNDQSQLTNVNINGKPTTPQEAKNIFIAFKTAETVAGEDGQVHDVRAALKANGGDVWGLYEYLREDLGEYLK